MLVTVDYITSRERARVQNFAKSVSTYELLAIVSWCSV